MYATLKQLPALALVGLIWAQTAIAQQVPPSSELAALKYYFDGNNQSAVDAELRRLKAKFPDWDVPADISDIFRNSEPADVSNIYELIKIGNLKAAEQKIDDLRNANSGWTPPKDMIDLLTISKAQEEFNQAASTGNYDLMNRTVRRVPQLLSCERVNNSWLLAQAHIANDKANSALSIYTAIASTCRDKDVLVATLEKSEAITTPAQLSMISDRAQITLTSARPAIKATENRLLVGRGLKPRWTETGAIREVKILKQSAPAVTPTEPKTDARQVRSKNVTSNLGVSGVRALAKRGAWKECLQKSNGSRNLAVQFERGWCAFNAERPLEAIKIFADIAKRTKSPAQKRDAQFGQLLSMLRANMTEQSAQLAAAANLTNVQRIDIESQILEQRGRRAYALGNYDDAVAYFNAQTQLLGYTHRGSELLRGYAFLKAGNRSQARQIFQTLHNQLETDETRQALGALR